MPHLNGLETARRLRDRAPDQEHYPDDAHGRAHVFAALRPGGRLCREDAGGGGYRAGHPHRGPGRDLCSPWVANSLVQAWLRGTPLPQDPLTSREREVVQRIAEGQTTKEIAAGLELSVKTVESHRINLMRKLDIHETATLVRYAIRRGLTAA